MTRSIFKLAFLSAAMIGLAGCGHQPMSGAVATSNVRTPQGMTTEYRDPKFGSPSASSPIKAITASLFGTRNDDLAKAKQHFKNAAYGLAEQHYRLAVEKVPNDAEAWLGLAASYDQLGRYDLADRAYEAATRLAGPTVAILNNQGYSYLLREDRQRARQALNRALNLEPNNPVVRGNLELLEKSIEKNKGVS